jgi:hypothetical protein
MRPSAAEYLTSGWVSFQSATLGQFCTGGYTVARAHRWFDEISTGNARSLAAIAAREELAVRYVGRLIRLAFLAPDIVESIVEGRQPTTLTAEALTRRIELPLSWCSQRTALNVE